MIERKNIDRLFQEKFKDFEAAPPEHVWEKIDAELRKKDDRRILPLWFRLSGIAAALMIGLIITDNVVDRSEFDVDQNSVVLEMPGSDTGDSPDQPNTDAVVTSNGDQNPDTNEVLPTPGSKRQVTDNEAAEYINTVAVTPPGKGKKAAPKRQSPVRSEKLNVADVRGEAIAQQSVSNTPDGNTKKKSGMVSNQQRSAIASQSQDNAERNSLANNDTPPANQTKIDEKRSNDSAFPATTENTNTIIAENTADDIKIDTAAIATVVPNSLEELLNEKENNVTTNEPKLNRWQVSSNVAPIYFSSTSNGSPIDPALAQNNKDYKQNLTYGLGVRYALNDKFTVRTGVNSIGLEYSTNDVVFYQNTNARPLQHVSTNMQGSVIQIESKGAAASPEMTPGSNELSKFDANINQKTGYIEVPVELAYKVIDKKFGVEIIGGVSTLFLNENRISMTSAGTEMEIGKANNLNSTHFSTNIGVGVKYNFFKSFQVNVEPMFKYQINTFTDSGNFKPYFFGLYTGINYRF